MTYPGAVSYDGNLLLLWVPASVGIADPNDPGISELTDNDVLDLTVYCAEGGWAPSLSEASVPDNRLASAQDFAQPGRQTHTGTVAYVTNPDVPAEDEARLTLTEGAEGFFVERIAVPYTSSIAAGDLVNVYPAKLGAQQVQERTANTKWRIMQNWYLRPPGRQFMVTVAFS